MFNKVLIANRGAIACRIIRTLKHMNITSVAVYAEADAESLHVRLADEAFSLGEGSATKTYLDQQKLIGIAKRSGAEAIHPGYGFLSENPDFVDLSEREGIVFIGPSAANMNAFALKHQARSLAERQSVPLIPGTDLLQDKSDAIEAAATIGYPIILKSTAGGGGIGMQVCDSEEQLNGAFDSVVRLSENNFSNGGVFVEKFIPKARHIEVQIFGDGLGNAVALGERDCSLQRRNQKVIEETPAPGLTDAERVAMHETAVRLVASVNYASAGTVEFIFDIESRQFYFLEVNTRLQVEHGVTEMVFNVDLVQWMVEQAVQPIDDLEQRRANLRPSGHAIQARIYAENPALGFQPSAGQLTNVHWTNEPSQDCKLRIDTWVESGTEVSPFFDPMLAKVIIQGASREQAIDGLANTLASSQLYGIETNLAYAETLLRDPVLLSGEMYTAYLNGLKFNSSTIEVMSGGTLTTVQDLPGRQGYWEVGVPPSGPFDALSFRRGNALLGNDEGCAGLEITLNGPTLKFHAATQIVITGAELSISLNGEPQPNWTAINVKPGDVLEIGSIRGHGARSYLLVSGGIQCPDYLGSKSTFTLGQFGGHGGRALRAGDILHYLPLDKHVAPIQPSPELRTPITGDWRIHVIYGPHGAPDFFTDDDIDAFFSANWEVHFNSSRTGIRLIGPKPQWARETGGEAGMHPSNIHDNAYAFGTVDFTGDMPVILGPDGPSLGGFVCPATVIHADLWKLGQLKAGDKVRFVAVSIDDAVNADKQLSGSTAPQVLSPETPENCVIKTLSLGDGTEVVLRSAGDRFLLVEFGEQELNLELRFLVAALQEFLIAQKNTLDGALVDLTPGIRSLQVHYNPHRLSLTELVDLIESGCQKIGRLADVKVPSRIVHLPLSWDDEVCHQAVEKYIQSVRKDAPWCPDNIEFIRRINGLDSAEQVKDIVFNADYVVMGLGDVYLGAPVATPLDPRHRLVTTKYNPARTWTAENSVGIGGAYLCIYGMEGPGGYQFVGRTLQMWNRYRDTREFEKPWLLRFFDRIRFYPVSQEELAKIRRQFPLGDYPITIEESEFSLSDYQEFLATHSESISEFHHHRDAAFQAELQRWRDNGQFHFQSTHQLQDGDENASVPEGCIAVESSAAGNIWKICVEEGSHVERGADLLILESMKMEIAIPSPRAGVVKKILRSAGSQVSNGQALVYLEVEES
ncbi:MAG: urea carboxylase [bacterium]